MSRKAFDKSLEYCRSLQRQAQITMWGLKCFSKDRSVNCMKLLFYLRAYRFGVEVSCSVKQRRQKPALFERKVERNPSVAVRAEL